LASIAPSVAITSSVQSPTPVSVPPIQIQLAKGTTGSQSSDTANAALGIGIAALVVALLALGVGALALRRRASVGATAAHPSDDETGGWVSLGQAARALDMPSETVLQRIQAGQLEATYATSGRRKGLRVNLNGTNDIAARPSAPQTAQAGSTGPRDRAAGSSSGWLSLDQAAQAFGIPPAAVLRQVQTGQLDATYHTRGRQKGLRIKVASGGGPLPNPPSRPAAAPVNAAAAPTEKPSYGWLSLDEAARALAVPREVILSRIQAGTLEAIHANKGPHKGLRVKVEPFTNPRPGAGGS